MRQLCTLLAISVFATTTIAADIYSWTDKEGVTHFSESKPAYQAEINKVKLLPISATISASETTNVTPPTVKSEKPRTQIETEEQSEYQVPETGTDKNIISNRLVDRTDISLENKVNLDDVAIDSIEQPVLRQEIVERPGVSIKNAVKE